MLSFAVCFLKIRSFKCFFFLSGCYCTCCKASCREGNNLDFIRKGFSMNRSTEELISSYERLEKKGVWKRKTLPSDYHVRYGQTKPSLFKRLDATKVSHSLFRIWKAYPACIYQVCIKHSIISFFTDCSSIALFAMFLEQQRKLCLPSQFKGGSRWHSTNEALRKKNHGTKWCS